MPRHTTIHSTRTLTCCLCTLLLSCYACRDKVIVPPVGNGFCRTYYVNAYAHPTGIVASYEPIPYYCVVRDTAEEPKDMPLWWLGFRWTRLINDTLSSEFLALAHAHGEFGREVFRFGCNPQNNPIVALLGLNSFQVTGSRADHTQEDLSSLFTLSVRNKWLERITHNAKSSSFDKLLPDVETQALQWVVSSDFQGKEPRWGWPIQLWCKGELRPKLEAYKSLVLEVSLADGSKITTPLLLQSEKPTE